MNIIKGYWLQITIGMLFILIFPIVVSQIIRIPTGSWTIGKEDAWIGFLGGYIGATLGGVISGLLTLGGVYLTIQHERKIRESDTFPLKRKYASEVILKVDSFLITFSSYFDRNKLETEQLTFDFNETEIEEYNSFQINGNDLLNSATMVNSVFFSTTRKILTNLDAIKKLSQAESIHPYHYLHILDSLEEYAIEVIDLVGVLKEEATKIDEKLEKI